MIKLHCGDSVAVMRTLGDASVDSIVVDPPYGLSEHRHSDVVACLTAWLAGEEFKPRKKGFMGRAWDAWVPGPEVFREALRVAKPGAHMLCFAGTRSMDLMMMAVRLAGWELRESIGYAHDPGDPTQPALIAWTYGSGFPKNRDVSRLDMEGEAAEEWKGWGTALKPAWEPIIIARKPLEGTVAENLVAHGAGAYNIEACRVGDEDTRSPTYRMTSAGLGGQGYGTGQQDYTKTGALAGSECGRWPANVIHDGSDAVVSAFPDAPGARGDVTGDEPSSATANVLNPRARVPFKRQGEASQDRRYGAGGNEGFAPLPGMRREKADSAARFFYCAKASSADRHEGLEHPGPQFKKGSTLRDAENLGDDRKGNKHPTVKPTPLMRYLVRLVTRPGGTVLDFCMGSGSTGKAAEIEGMSFIGIDIDPENVETARGRIGAGNPLFQEAA